MAFDTSLIDTLPFPKCLTEKGYKDFVYDTAMRTTVLRHTDGSVERFAVDELMSLIAFEHDNAQLESRLKSVEHIQLNI
jgi:hypothetical protein